MNSKELILERLDYPPHYLANHELNIIGYSQNNTATRLPELAKEGKVISRYRKGTHYKEWAKIKYDEVGQGVSEEVL